MHLDLSGAMFGTILGILGAVLGTYFGIKATRGPKERRFVIKLAALMWIGITGFVLLMMVVESRYKWMLWIPYAVLLTITIVKSKQRQEQLRREESGLQ